MGCTTRCQNDDDCSKYSKYLPDDTLQWVCDKHTGSTEKLCMVAPNPRITTENIKEYLSTAEKNCSKLFLNAGPISYAPDDYCYNSKDS